MIYNQPGNGAGQNSKEQNMNRTLSDLERAAFCVPSVENLQAYCAALEAEMEEVGDARAENVVLSGENDRLKSRLASMETEHAQAVEALEDEIIALKEAPAEVQAEQADPSGENIQTHHPVAQVAADVAEWFDPSGALRGAGLMVVNGEPVNPSGEEFQPASVINCAAFRVVAVCPIWGDVLEVPNVDGGLSRVARRQLENPARTILAQYTKAGKLKGGKGIHRGNLLLNDAELTPAAAQESAMRARGWKVARYPRSAEQRAKLAGLGFEAYIQAGEGEFQVHPLGLVWAKPGEPSGEENGQRFTVGGIEFEAVRFMAPLMHWRPKVLETGEIFEGGVFKTESRPKMIASIEYAFQRAGSVEEFRRLQDAGNL